MSSSAGRVPAAPPAKGGVSSFLITLMGLGAVLSLLFLRSFNGHDVVFSNDGPLGVHMSEAFSIPESFTGMWLDLNWLGTWGGSALPTLTYVLLWLLTPIGYAKFYAALVLLLLGLSAWLCLRAMGFHLWVCVLGAVAAALNMNFFSTATWGLGSLVVTVMGVFLALALIQSSRRSWVHYAVAGAAIGISVMEGFDKGAILSLIIAAVVLFQAWGEPGTRGARIARGLGRLAMVGVCAALVAAQALIVLIATQLQGRSTGATGPEAKAANWTYATQWSFPKIEVFRFLIPGLHGYGMPDMYGIPTQQYGGREYWGSIGQDPTWEKYLAGENVQPRGILRLSGEGEYPGLLVVLVAVWAITQAFRGSRSSLSDAERRWVWFWAGAATISLLFAFGRYAPFYQIVYALPYFHTIRSPVKWLHPFHLSVVMLFAYGMQSLVRQYGASTGKAMGGWRDQLSAWWSETHAFEHAWVKGLGVWLGLSAVGWLIYTSSRSSLEAHLQRVGFDPALAPSIAAFSIREVGWYLLVLVLSGGLLVLLLSGWLAGRRLMWFMGAAAVLLSLDLARANRPWIVHYNYKERYATNPIVDLLREKPYAHRVSCPPSLLGEKLGFFYRIYFLDWLQYLFQYYNVQSIDISQMPRMPQDIEQYQAGLGAQPMRLWELTNTRYLIGAADVVEALNQQLDPLRRRFRLHTAIELARATESGPILVRTNASGPLALIEFTGALPRVGAYGRWEVMTNDVELVKRLADPAFDPAQTVLLSSAPEGLEPRGATNAPAAPGSVRHVRYAPKRVELEAEFEAPGLLLLNDRYDVHWRVRVNGEPRLLLRANHQMRAVALGAGKHHVEFRFQPPTAGFKLSIGAIAIGLALSLWIPVAFRGRRAGESAAPPEQKR